KKIELANQRELNAVKIRRVAVDGLSDAIEICSNCLLVRGRKDVITQMLVEETSGNDDDILEVVLDQHDEIVRRTDLQDRVPFRDGEIGRGLKHERSEIAVVRQRQRSTERDAQRCVLKQLMPQVNSGQHI